MTAIESYDLPDKPSWRTSNSMPAKRRTAYKNKNGGIKNGAFWGQFNYVDQGSGMHVKPTAVTGYAADSNDPDCRIIDYAVTFDGQRRARLFSSPA